VDLQNWGSGVWSFSHERALLARDARLRWTVAGLGSRLSKVNQEVVLEGQGADAEVNGVLFTDGAQHLSYHTRQHHQAPHTHSDLLYKGVLEDRSRIVWRGMIRVDPDAQKTDAYQRNDNLVLSRNARADSIPGLEIEADDVRCTHGATAGRVDDDQVFYSMCRGLSRDEAVHMIVEGFFRGVYDRIGLESVAEGLDRAVADKIGH
jgi:Fe-S cluster assembly protein SufD